MAVVTFRGSTSRSPDAWCKRPLVPESANISGRVGRVVFNKDDYYILSIEVDSTVHKGMPPVVTAKGPIYGLLQLRRDVPLRLVGKWVNDKKYGRQFSIQTWEPWAGDEDDVEMFLHTCVDGFADRSVAATLAAELGVEAFDLLTKGGAALQENPPGGLDGEVLAMALLGWSSALGMRDLSEMLKEGGLNSTEIRLAMFKFGSEAAGLVRENPYRLMEIPTFSFLKVDRIGLHLGIRPNDPRRLEGAVLWALQESAFQGHLFLRRGEIVGQVVDLFHAHEVLSFPQDERAAKAYDEALEALVARKALVLEPGVGVYLPEYYVYERKSAELLARRLVPSPIELDPAPFLEQYEQLNQITLSPAQRSAVEQLVQSRVLVLTGLPGTGKTTAVRAVVRFFEEARLTFALMAPTGIAAKRLSVVTGHNASTIHRALKYDGTRWGHSESNRYVVDAVIIDEMSMVDMELFYRLLSALPDETLIVLVGDDAQLPSVGPGNVLRELVECEGVPNVRLTQIFRQSEKGEIVLNSHRINRGEPIVFGDPKDNSEFKFVRTSDEDRIVSFIVQLAAKLKSKDANFQVLSPKYEGPVGVNNLNDKLRDQLNPPGGKEWKKDGQHFRVGDRLMVIRNDYEKGVYNGDVGKLIEVRENTLLVKIHDVEAGMDMEVEFTHADAVQRLRLAYAVTVHKSQGSEFDTIIIPIVRSQGRMLQRNLLYTGVTRARKQVWLCGEESAAMVAISNNKVIRRNTCLGAAVLAAPRPEPVSGVKEGE